MDAAVNPSKEDVFKTVQLLDAELSILHSLDRPNEQWQHTITEISMLLQKLFQTGALVDITHDETRRKQLSTEVFLLFQHSLQSGPLKGAKPGYFKRCDSSVVGIVVNEVFPRCFGMTPQASPETVDFNKLGAFFAFTPNQVKAVSKWYKNAWKAAVSYRLVANAND